MPHPDVDARAELEELRRRLQEAEETLAAIRSGDVDAIVVQAPGGPSVYTLEGAAHPYRVLIEAMNEGAATLAGDGAILWCNSRFARLLDAPLSRVMGASLQDWVPPHAKFAFAAFLREAARSEAKGEYVFRAPAGVDVPVHLSASALDDEGRRMLCLIATDLTRQKLEMDAILASMTDGLLVFDARGRIVRANGAAIRVLGFDPVAVGREGLEQRAQLEWPGGRKLRREEYPSTRALAGETCANLAVVVVRGEDRLAFDVSCSPLEEDGEITGAVSVWHDVTAIEQAKADLEEADRRKDHFLAVLSHELRNPLMPVKNSLYVLDRSEAGGEKARRARDVIERQIDQLARLVDDLLDVTRIARGKSQLHRGRLNLKELVRRTLDDHAALLEISGLELHLDQGPGEVSVNADANRISQVLSNLLHNATKFTPRGGRVSVSVAADAARGEAVLRVADSGIGMDPRILAHVFEPFVQADATLDRASGGLGLGLALARGLVEQHGGTIEAKSAGPGHGSEFTVRLPLDLTQPAASGERRASGSRTPRRVLVIDDNADAAESLREVLELNGHEVAVAYNGPEGLAKAREQKPEVVLCDIGLPGMDGYAVARAFREDEALRGTHLVALTGYTRPEDVQRAAEAGFETHIGKPPSIAKIEEVLAGVGPRPG